MRSRPRKSFALALALWLLAPLAAADGQEPAPRPPSRLVVQVEYFKGAPLAYQTVPGGSWFGRFARVPTPQPRAPADTVLAVDVKTRLDGERAEIIVGVHVGARHFDRLEGVATYHAAAGETVEARELERVGVAPFVFKVLRVNDSDTAAPTIVNRTQLIEATVSEFTQRPLPRARIALRNLSSKKVRAVELRQVLNGRERVTSLAAEREGKALIEPGGTYQKLLWMTSGQESGADFTPEAVESVIIASVVFEDYTHEGELLPAARKRAFDEGERLQLTRLLALLGRAEAAPESEAQATAGRLRGEVLALGDAGQQAPADALLKSYPGLDAAGREQLRSALEVSMHALRRQLLEDLDAFEKRHRLAPAENGFRDWLRAKREKFEQWLSRL